MAKPRRAKPPVAPKVPAAPTPARVVAFDVLIRVQRDQAFADRALDRALQKADLREDDRRLVTELVYGTLRHTIHLDFLLSQLTRRPLSKVQLPVLMSLRMGAYQLLHTRVPARAAVNEAVSLIARRHEHARGFVNAVLRQLARRHEQRALPRVADSVSDPLDAMAREGSHPTWHVREIASHLGPIQTRAWIVANNNRPSLGVRVNCRRATVDQMADALSQSGALVSRHAHIPCALELHGAGTVTTLPGLDDGRITIQDLAAQLVGLLADPAPGGLVLDACAAPGGKSTHLAELMDNQGTILAMDIHPGKTRLIAGAARRLGLSTITPQTADATQPVAIQALLTAHQREDVDLALVDAPCTGLGTLRRHPELRNQSPDKVTTLCQLQDRLLESVGPRVRPGGLLIYSVCTSTRAEGPARVKRFLDHHPDFVVDAVDPSRFGPFLAAESPLNQPHLRTWPHLHGMDGFFAARLRRQILA